MNIEYDPDKSAANLAKHGIDFDAAKALWGDPGLLEVAARTEDEPRYLLLGTIEDRFWAAVVTYREGRVRILSVRRARAKEVALYESQ